jgi:urease accessory protein
MQLVDAPLQTGWHARLALAYERRTVNGQARTVLAVRQHDGPLLTQKPLYPEGDAVCHSILIHPPAGIAGGDRLELHANANAQAHALLTTPGAGKWYRSTGLRASQRLNFDVAAQATMEWLPQETIVYDGALAELSCEVRLGPGARYLGWEVLCLGRAGSGERFTRGHCELRTLVTRNDQPIWFERGAIAGGGALMRSPAGLGGKSVCGTLIAAAETIGDEVLQVCRGICAEMKDCTVTRLPGLLVARYLGDSSEAAKQVFVALWRQLRPALLERAAIEPRIWRT